jgi:hypothetical protein
MVWTNPTPNSKPEPSSDDRPASLRFYLVGCCGDWTIVASRENGSGDWIYTAKHRDGERLMRVRHLWVIRECLGMQQPS